MSHRHDSMAGTQNQGNTLGTRSCVRQSKLYRQYESGNSVKAALGTPHLAWQTNKKQGAYEGHDVYDHNTPGGYKRYSNAGSRRRDDEYEYAKDTSLRNMPRHLPQASAGRNPSYESSFSSRSDFPSDSPRRVMAPPPSSVIQHQDVAPTSFTDEEIRMAIERETRARLQKLSSEESSSTGENILGLANVSHHAQRTRLQESPSRYAVRYDGNGDEIARTVSKPPAAKDHQAQVDFHLSEYQRLKRLAAEDVPTHSSRPTGRRPRGEDEQPAHQYFGADFGSGVSAKARGRTRVPEDSQALSLNGNLNGNRAMDSQAQWSRSSDAYGSLGESVHLEKQPWDALAPTTYRPMNTTRRGAGPASGGTRPW